MSRLVKILLIGFAFFALAFFLVLAIVFVRSKLSGLNFDLAYTIKSSLKSGLGVGITMMILFIFGAPRPKNPH